MAKLTYLQLVNRILKRITQSEVATVTGVSGTTKIITELINEAQNELWTEETNWYSLYKMRTFNTTVYTASTIAFNNANPDTITDSASGMSGFQAGQTIVVSGSTSNDGVYVIGTAAAGTLTLQTADSLTAEAAGSSVTIYAVTYPLASNFGRCQSLTDYTNNRNLIEDSTKIFDEVDPDMSEYNDPTHFSIQGDFYRLHYIPNGTVKIIDRYWAFPTPLASDSDTSDLPLFCENFIIHWSLMGVLEYLHKFEDSDRIRTKIYGSPAREKEGMLFKVKSANQKIVDRMLRMQKPSESVYGIQPPRYPSSYGVNS